MTVPSLGYNSVMSLSRSVALLSLISILLVLPAVTVGDPVKLLPEATFTCVYDNQTYSAGHKFQPDPCMSCKCPRRGGRVQCVVEDCQNDANCVHYVKQDGACCGFCREYGCLHTDGKVYRLGQGVPVESSCQHCSCPKNGGPIECSRTPCPRAMCVDAVLEEGQCCPSCPNGPNCWLGKKVLKASEEVRVNKCKTCRCPSDEDSLSLHHHRDRKLKAVCTIGNCS